MAREITVKENLIYKTKIFDLYENDVKLENNKIAKRALIKHNGAVCLIVKNKDNFIFVKQYRQGVKDELLELVAGKLEENEDPKECALRELKEETGYSAKSIKYFGKIAPVAAYSTEIIYCFVVDVQKRERQKLDEDEFLEVVEIPKEEVENMYIDGKFIDGKTLGFLGRYLILKNLCK